MDDDPWLALAQAMRREVPQHFPEWTDSNSHDPGTTLLELFAWLTENLRYRAPTMKAANAVIVAQRLATAADTLAQAATADAQQSGCTHLQRVNYFQGQMLSADDFRDEQEYFRRRLRRLNRALHGLGVVTGLAVSIDGTGIKARVLIEPGLALDAHGEEIEIPECISLTLPTSGKTLFVQVRYLERSCKPVPVAVSDDGSDVQPSRIAETFEAVLAPAESARAVTLARLRHARGRWSVERRVRRKTRP